MVHKICWWNECSEWYGQSRLSQFYPIWWSRYIISREILVHSVFRFPAKGLTEKISKDQTKTCIFCRIFVIALMKYTVTGQTIFCLCFYSHNSLKSLNEYSKYLRTSALGWDALNCQKKRRDRRKRSKARNSDCFSFK